MTGKAKVENYGADAIAYMQATYLPESLESERDSQMDQIAEKLGKTVASVRSKLSHMSMYVPKIAAAKKGKRSTKADVLTRIAAVAGLKNDDFFGSLAGANRDVLLWIVQLQTKEFDLENELFDTDEQLIADAAKVAADAAKAESAAKSAS
jgi:hypothetical protein